MYLNLLSSKEQNNTCNTTNSVLQILSCILDYEKKIISVNMALKIKYCNIIDIEDIQA